MNQRLLCSSALAVACAAGVAPAQPIQVSFLWHMHQPRYVPGESLFGADGFFSFSVVDVHNSRFGPYTSWPANAIGIGSSMAHLGAHVSFSGSLIQNLNELEAAGVNGGMWSNWEASYRGAQSNTTTLGNRRLDMLAFGYHHPLMPLLDERSIRKQVQLHKLIHGQTWQTGYSAGMFPAETAFSTRMIPALVAEGIDWVMVDNIHFDRACVGYPHTNATGIVAPNRADQINPDPASNGGRWVQLQNLWAPSRVSVPFGYQPHNVQHVDPATGEITRMVAVPAARYEGNEDGRGGYGAFLYDGVMDAYLPDNNAADRPMLVLLHHDGDNFGGGSEAYYNSNFQNMVSWASADPDYDVTTVDDYLARFPVPADSLIHVEDGSWAGADSGDPEFKKWLGGDVSAGAVSPDINSWAALVAATNHVYTLDDLVGGATNNQNIINGVGAPIERAWHHLLTGQASDYWYWDGTEVWDSNVTRASNAATAAADAALAAAFFQDTTEPTVFVPQREPYNPGGFEFGAQPEPSDFEVWTLVHDYSGVQSVTLKWRVDADGVNPLDSIQNETFAGGAEVGPWQSQPMSSSVVPTPAGVLNATHKARRYGAMITDQSDVLIDYYVEAIDSAGNVSRSPIMHVYVGSTVVGGGERVEVDPEPVQAGSSVTVSYDPAGGPIASATQYVMHYGFNGWTGVTDAAMSDADDDGVWEVTVGVPSDASVFNLVFNNGNGNWDNNAGQDWQFAVEGGTDPVDPIIVDGQLDSGYTELASRGGVTLWAAFSGSTLYVAATPAGAGNDRFVVLAEQPGATVPSMWGKAGTVAQWDAFIGNEESNGWAGWFDQSGATQVARGSVLEGSIELQGELGSVPDGVNLAVLSFATADGGALAASSQVPAGNGDGSVQAGEFLTVRLCELSGTCCPADLTGEGTLDIDDVLAFLDAFGSGDGAADLAEPQGTLNIDDVLAFLAAFAAGCG